MNPNSKTLDGSAADGWAVPRQSEAGGLQPRLRVLYHIDLSRIGAFTALDAISPFGEACEVGRRGPVFAPVYSGQPAQPLDDPLVSRSQFTVAWLASDQVFEVRPCPGAKRPLSVVSLDPEEGEAAAQPAPIVDSMRLPPGGCVAIGDRVLLGLELVSQGERTDRLGFLGDSEAAWRLRDEIRSVARFGGPALVTGPTGAGKELVARAIHAQSDRAGGPFVPVNCGALPDRLVESLLFGHRKGAFTGAEAHEPGLFAAASGGVLFLDELGELPALAQPKLLRVLQDGVVVPVGGHAGRATDVRLIAATNRDLQADVAAGKLREDLYHRVAGHRVEVPALAARPLDVPGLFVHFLTRLGAKHPELDWLWRGRQQWRPTIPIRFFADLLRRPWPGNVRELEHYVERTARRSLQEGVFRAPLDSPEVPAPAVSGPEPSAAVEGDALARASALLGLAHKTVAKLVPPRVLATLQRDAEAERWPEAVHRDWLRNAVSDALYEQLRAVDFSRTRAAADADMSRTTFGKLLREFGVRRAADLSPAELLAVRAQAKDDLLAAARHARVSPEGLRRQLTLLSLKERAQAESDP